MPVVPRLVALALALQLLTADVATALATDAPGRVAIDEDSGAPVPAIVLGLADASREEALLAIGSTFGPKAREAVLDVTDLGSARGALEKFDYVLALGAEACLAVASDPPSVEVLCTLLYADAFAASVCSEGCDRFEAIVMDPPLSRQVAVSTAVYPRLRRFGVFNGAAEHGMHGDRSAAGDRGNGGKGGNGGKTGENAGSVPGNGLRNEPLHWKSFDSALPLKDQIAVLLRDTDALIVTPDPTIHNASTLRSTLLTAYGYGRPVIGFSPAYVRAGALLTTYSTAWQVLRQAREWSRSFVPPTTPRYDLPVEPAVSLADGSAARPVEGSADGPVSRAGVVTDRSVRYADKFSIIDNPSVARSLGLSRGADVDEERTFSDEDFRS